MIRRSPRIRRGKSRIVVVRSEVGGVGEVALEEDVDEGEAGAVGEDSESAVKDRNLMIIKAHLWCIARPAGLKDPAWEWALQILRAFSRRANAWLDQASYQKLMPFLLARAQCALFILRTAGALE